MRQWWSGSYFKLTAPKREHYRILGDGNRPVVFGDEKLKRKEKGDHTSTVRIYIILGVFGELLTLDVFFDPLSLACGHFPSRKCAKKLLLGAICFWWRGDIMPGIIKVARLDELQCENASS